MIGWSKEKLYTRLTMAQLEELLFPQGFLRIHKQYLVNMTYLQSLQSTGAVLTTGKSLKASARNYRENQKNLSTGRRSSYGRALGKSTQLDWQYSFCMDWTHSI